MAELDTAVNPDADGLVGGLTLWGSDVLPSAKYQFAEAQAVSRTVFSLLFSRYGTKYGTGDGSTTFNLPNLKDKVPRGGDGTTVITGVTGGTAAATMPTHGHAMSGAPGGTFGSSSHTHTGTSGGPTGTANASTPGDLSGLFANASHTHDTTTGGPSGTASPTLGSLAASDATGSGDNWPPYVTMRWIVKVA